MRAHLRSGGSHGGWGGDVDVRSASGGSDLAASGGAASADSDEVSSHSQAVEETSFDKSSSSSIDVTDKPIVPKKSERVRNLSLKAREGKALNLHTTLVKFINGQLISNEKLLATLDSLELAELQQHITELEQSFDTVTEMYKELCSLCDNNKPSKPWKPCIMISLKNSNLQ